MQKKRLKKLKLDWKYETDKFLSSKEWKFMRLLTYTYFPKKCTNCGSEKLIHLDHIIPRVKDNKGHRWLDITNLQPLCEKCNTVIKGTKCTDYRDDEQIKYAIKLKPLFELRFKEKGFKTSWDLWLGKKGKRKIRNKTTPINNIKRNKKNKKDNSKSNENKWKNQIVKCFEDKIYKTEEILEILNITNKSPYFIMVNRSINHKRKLFINSNFLNLDSVEHLYSLRNYLSRKQFVLIIEKLFD